MFRYDRRLRDNPEVKKLVEEVWKETEGCPIRERIAQTRTAIAAWSKNQYRNSRLLIEDKQQELDSALSRPVNDT